MYISHILFDFGGVVINHKVPQAIPSMFNQIASHYDVSRDELISFWHQEIDPRYMAGIMTYEELIRALEVRF